MSDTEKKKSGIFSPIRSRDDALKIVKEVSYCFYLVAVLCIVIAFVFKIPAVSSGLVFLGLGLYLHKFKSRIAAVLLLLFSIYLLVPNVLICIQEVEIKAGLFMSILYVFASVRALEATIKLRGKFRDPDLATKVVIQS